jgi:hypothetical protein
LVATSTTHNPFLSSNLQPQGRNIWDSHFKFYRVLETHVKLTFVNCRPSSSSTSPFDGVFVCGYELVDENAPISNNTDMFLMTKNAKREILPAAPRQPLFNNSGVVVDHTAQAYPTRVIQYSYRPQQWDYHVEEKSTEERWTPMKQNPALDHLMAVRVMHLDDISIPNRDESVGVMIEISYKVQFREATDSFFKTRDTTSATYGGAGEDPADDV